MTCDLLDTGLGTCSFKQLQTALCLHKQQITATCSRTDEGVATQTKLLNCFCHEADLDSKHALKLDAALTCLDQGNKANIVKNTIVYALKWFAKKQYCYTLASSLLWHGWRDARKYAAVTATSCESIVSANAACCGAVNKGESSVTCSVSSWAAFVSKNVCATRMHAVHIQSCSLGFWAELGWASLLEAVMHGFTHKHMPLYHDT